jgi:predicted aspartyl protease
MGETHTEITLKNAGDKINAKRGLIKASEVRQVTVQAVVDTGATSLVISETVRKRLGLEIESIGEATYANNRTEDCPVTEPVAVHWKNRATCCEAMVVPGDGEVLIGVVPMEAMDLTPRRQEVTGAHGDKVMWMAK